MTDAIQLTDIIAPAFYPVHWDILDGNHTYYDLYGGRGSTKSSFISTEIVFGMMQDAERGIFSNGIVFRIFRMGEQQQRVRDEFPQVFHRGNEKAA